MGGGCAAVPMVPAIPCCWGARAMAGVPVITAASAVIAVMMATARALLINQSPPLAYRGRHCSAAAVQSAHSDPIQAGNLEVAAEVVRDGRRIGSGTG